MVEYDPSPARTETSSTSASVSPTNSRNTTSASGPRSPPTPGMNDCNESRVHSNIEKSVYHSTKGAQCLLKEGQYDRAIQIAANGGMSFLASEGAEYDAERSSEHLQRLIKNERDREAKISHALNQAFSKIEGGNHVGGARVAISIADEFLNWSYRFSN